MKKRLLLLTLYLSTQAAIADEVSVKPEPEKSLTTNSSFRPVKSPSLTAKQLSPSVEVTRDEAGRIHLDGKTFPERHPLFEKRVAKPSKKVLKPVIVLDRASGFHKLRHILSDAVIVGGAKFKPYEPAAGAVITASQLTNLVRGNHR